MSTLTKDKSLTEDYADSMQRDLRSEAYWEGVDVYDWLQDTLGIEVFGSRQLGTGQETFNVKGYSILLGWGGPNVYLEIDWNGEAELRVLWGGDSSTRYIGGLPDVLEALQELDVIW